MASGRLGLKATGAAELADLGRQLKAAGATGLRKELYSGLNRAAQPMRDAVQAEARAVLPSGGGRGVRKVRKLDTGTTLTNAVSGRTHKIKRVVRVKGAKGLKTGDSVAERVAGASYTVRSVAGKNPRVTLKVTPKRGKGIDLKSLDAGRLRHPLFGNRRHWYQQSVTPGWFSRPVDEQAPQVRVELLKAIDAVKRQL